MRRLVACLVLILLPAAAGAQDATPPALGVPHTLFTLPNGLTIIVHEDRSVPLVSVNMWYHVGSGREKPGRTGFAHLFEHLMFEGSKHVEEGAFDTLLEAAGGNNNGSTNQDRTNYWIDVPSNALELALFLESDRMGWLLDVMSPERVDGQRDVVKNERRQGVENRPYGIAGVTLGEMLYPKAHPYSWPTIGHMEDLTAASHEDVVDFFQRYYAPGNASLVIAGDVDAAQVRPLIEKWFGEIEAREPVAPIEHPPAVLTRVERRTLHDRVQLPRLYLGWLTAPHFAPGDAELDVVGQILAGGKNSRLYRRLVYDLQIAQDVFAFQGSGSLSSAFHIVVTPRLERKDGAQVSPDAAIEEIRQLIDEELERLRDTPPEPRELERALNQIEASFLRSLESVGGFGGKADRLNAYYFATGNPDYFNEDLARYRALSVTDIRAAVRHWLPAGRRIELTVLPESAPSPE
jgi:zinc protease